jgi:dTDP-4-dehydrorhamnose reductase
MNVLVTGGSGQLGQSIREVAQDSEHRFIFTDLTSVEDVLGLDITDHDAVCRAVEEHDVDVIVNCAGYTDVEKSESEEEIAFKVNAEAVSVLAAAAERKGASIIHISTDYVFGGDDNRDKPYGESEATNPINVYGATKAEGEGEVLRHGGVVVRTSWLYSPWGKNFCRTILRNAKTHSMLRVVDDQRGTPTSAISLARALIGIVERGAYKAMEGIYHYTNMGETTWYAFACEIIARSNIEGCNITPCSSDEWPAEARRPHYSCLNTERMGALGITMAGWREALEEVITIIGQDDDI